MSHVLCSKLYCSLLKSVFGRGLVVVVVVVVVVLFLCECLILFALAFMSGGSAAGSNLGAPVQVGKQRNADATIYVGELDGQVTEEILWELFLQVGPVVYVHIPKVRPGRGKKLLLSFFLSFFLSFSFLLSFVVFFFFLIKTFFQGQSHKSALWFWFCGVSE